MAKRAEWYPLGSLDDLPVVLHDERRIPSRVLRGIKGFDAPAYSFASYASAGVDGVRVGQVTATRELTVPVFIQASSRAEMRHRKSEIVSAFDPKRGPGRLVVSEGIGTDAGTARFIEAIYRDGLRGDGVQGGLDDWWRFDLTLECTDPYWYSVDPLRATWVGLPSDPFFPFTLPFTLSESGVVALDVLEVTGDADTWPSFDLYGPFTRVRVSMARVPDGFWEINRAVGAQEMLRITTAPNQETLTAWVTTDGVSYVPAARSNVWSALGSEPWFEPLRFRDEMIVEVEGTSSATRVELTAAEAWNTGP